MHHALHETSHAALEGTGRLETFSDGVMAIIVTLLILELRVPLLTDTSFFGVTWALVPLLPKFIGFALSFVTVAIFWVNHHHFFHPVTKSDAALLWYNNHLLFWLAVIPFVTAFIGDYPTVPFVVALYGFVLFMGALAFALMMRHVFFHSVLLPDTIPLETRKFQLNRSLFGVLLYGISVVAAFVSPYISLAIFVIIPLYYFLPRRLQDGFI